MRFLRINVTFFLLLACTLLGASSLLAQDHLDVQLVRGSYSWSFTVTNGNAEQLPINKIILHSTNPDFIFDGGGDKPAQWNLNPADGEEGIEYSTTGSAAVAKGTSLGGFIFSAQVNEGAFEQPVTINWITMVNDQQLGSGSFTVIPTQVQLQKTLDIVTATTALSGSDPCFTFKVANENASNASIDQVSFELLTQAAGTMLPSKLSPPTDWRVDSASPLTVTFGTATNPIDAKRAQDNFKVCLRANPNVKNYSFVWRTFTGGTLISRDTIRNLAITPGNNPTSDCDSVAATVTSACTFDLKLSNYHASNQQQPSKITGFSLKRSGTGITFKSVEIMPAGWNKSITDDAIVFAASNEASAIPSGKKDEAFRFTLDNPSGDPFTIDWKTTLNQTEICTGTLALQCSVAAPTKDELTVTTAPGQCCYRVTLNNKHNTPAASDIYGVSLTLNKGAKFTGPMGTASGWTIDSVGAKTSIRFRVASGQNPLAPNATEELGFCVIPPQGTEENFTVNWSTYDANGLINNQALSTGTFDISCQFKPTVRDTTTVTQLGNDCSYNFAVTNKHAEDVNKVVIAPKNGWSIESATAPIGWNKTIDVVENKVTFTGQGIPNLVELGGFQVKFFALVAPQEFNVDVQTFTNTESSTQTIPLSCTPLGGVNDKGISKPMTLSIAPNPFTTSTGLTFTMPQTAYATVSLIDVLGRTQQTLFEGLANQGTHEVRLNGSSLTPGTYYVRVESAFGRITQRVVLNR